MFQHRSESNERVCHDFFVCVILLLHVCVICLVCLLRVCEVTHSYTYNCMSAGDYDEINDLFGCGNHGAEVPPGSCSPFNMAMCSRTFAGFSACSGYSEKHTLVHDGDHGGESTTTDLSFIVLLL